MSVEQKTKGPANTSDFSLQGSSGQDDIEAVLRMDPSAVSSRLFKYLKKLKSIHC